MMAERRECTCENIQQEYQERIYYKLVMDLDGWFLEGEKLSARKN